MANLIITVTLESIYREFITKMRTMVGLPRPRHQLLYVSTVKPTGYLHRRSDHGSHTFRSTSFSQFRRAIVICLKEEDRVQSIMYMAKKFMIVDKQAEIDIAKDKAFKLVPKGTSGDSETL